MHVYKNNKWTKRRARGSNCSERRYGRSMDIAPLVWRGVRGREGASLARRLGAAAFIVLLAGQASGGIELDRNGAAGIFDAMYRGTVVEIGSDVHAKAASGNQLVRNVEHRLLQPNEWFHGANGSFDFVSVRRETAEGLACGKGNSRRLTPVSYHRRTAFVTNWKKQDDRKRTGHDKPKRREAARVAARDWPCNQWSNHCSNQRSNLYRGEGSC